MFVTEEILYSIERGQTMAHYCTHLFRQQTMTLCAAGCIPQVKLLSLNTLLPPGFRWCDHSVGKFSVDAGSLCTEV